MDSEFVAFVTDRIGISLVVTVFSYLFILVCIVLLEKKYEIKKLKKINTLNCIIVWSIFRIIEIASGNTPSSGTPRQYIPRATNRRHRVGRCTLP